MDAVLWDLQCVYCPIAFACLVESDRWSCVMERLAFTSKGDLSTQGGVQLSPIFLNDVSRPPELPNVVAAENLHQRFCAWGRLLLHSCELMLDCLPPPSRFSFHNFRSWLSTTILPPSALLYPRILPPVTDPRDPAGPRGYALPQN